MFIPPGQPEDLDATVRAGLLTALLFLVALLMPWRRLPAWMQSLPPLAYFVVIALLREAGGGASSGFGMLLMLPVFWFAFTELGPSWRRPWPWPWPPSSCRSRRSNQPLCIALLDLDELKRPTTTRTAIRPATPC